MALETVVLILTYQGLLGGYFFNADSQAVPSEFYSDPLRQSAGICVWVSVIPFQISCGISLEEIGV